MEKALLRKRLIVSPIWFLPLLALCIGFVLLISSYRNSGIAITLHFSGAEGVTAGKTKVIYKGIQVGSVSSVVMDSELEGVDITVEMDRVTKKSLVADTMFWIVRPEVSAGRITGLDTLVSGAYITLRMGKSKKSERHFTGLSEPPPMGADTRGLHIRLKTNTLYSLQRGSYVYSRNLRIGKVDDYRLEQDGTIMVDLLIQPEFTHLVREGTRFWNASGLSVTGDLQRGLSINVESMASLIYGGLTCGTAESLKETPPAHSGQIFTLYKDFADAEYGIPMTLQLASGDGIVPGRTKVMFRGLKAGIVRSIDISNDDFHTVTASILLDPRAEKILRENTRFWVVRPQVSLSGIKNLETLVSGAYITFQVGDGERQDRFVVDSSPMPKLFLRAGKRFQLEAEDSGSLGLGSPVLYKRQAIGEVTDLQLSASGDSLAVEVLVYEQYAGLVKNTTRFYTASGVQLDASLQGISLQTASLNSLIMGGISFFTPANGGQVKDDHVFPLYPGREEALRAGSLFLTLEFFHGGDITPKTKIKYKGITVGTLVRTWYDPDKDRVFAKAAVQQRFSRLFRQTTNIWLVKPRVNLSGVQHLGTLISGPYLELLPGSGGLRTRFAVQDAEPKLSGLRPGLHLVLEAEQIGSLKKGSPLYYRQVEIGRISGIELGPTAQMVWIHVVIAPKYIPLVHRSSRFWNAGGVKMIAGLFSGVSVETESLESIIAGGIAMATPEEPGTPAEEGDHFLLAEEGREAWLAWSPKITLPQKEQRAEQHRVQAGKKKKRIRSKEKR
ncbi:MAG: MlaD family protein [Candidatus Electrothrix sp. GW3-4]|uniref:PqiB family protein n=1 Tax=Candidatus Electrothrix sp. GW3-4 TaxID=3126740 RepID=UPI0030CC99D0